MKSFFKYVLANMVAILILCGVFFFMFVMVIAVASASGSGKVRLKENTVLTLTSKVQIVDSPTEDRESLTFLSSDVPQNIMLYDILEAIKQAKTDDKIKGISLEADFLNAGFTQIDDIRRALEDFKKSGKFVYAYGNMVSQSSYYLGTVADKYYLNPAGRVDLKGLSSEVVFYKDFTEKYGIGMEVLRHGKFKAAVEPFLRNEISEENKEQLSKLLGDLWGNASAKIAVSRKIDAGAFKTVVDSLYGLIPENTLKYRLTDQLVQKSEYDKMLKTKLGLKSEDELHKVSFLNYIKSYESDKEEGERIAVLYASGTIQDGNEYEGISSERYVEYIKELQQDDEVKAVVLRINSPGGSANASDEILFELQQLKNKKPVVVSFGDYAASGGYYIAMAADKIYSSPNTLTGSIGVFGMIPNAKKLAERNGIRSDVVQTNENANYISLLQGLSPGGRMMMQKSVEGTYRRFVNFVAKNRQQTFDQIDAVGGGRVWSGTAAKTLGLVDELGTLNDAIAHAASLAKSKKYHVRSYPERMGIFEEFFGQMDEQELSTRWMKSQLSPSQYEIYRQVKTWDENKGILMESPYKLVF
ncbi:signal peptide peptidase SppA [Bergeyella sp. RCAD1439]|uniref:signal peptide peptidase SppA n=1 Tax=Bergeyella anatis TaxID=3113737 RepID=UPI002E190F62|nr:signal peptide peptidase SppA [Bergeyella sp. RCAD1439]